MNERRLRSKLLVYYLQLAEQGNQEASEKLKQLSKEIFQQEESCSEQVQIEVSFASGEKKIYPSIEQLSKVVQLSEQQLMDYITTSQADYLGRTYTFYEKINE